jgi:hypothetical protein
LPTNGTECRFAVGTGETLDVGEIVGMCSIVDVNSGAAFALLDEVESFALLLFLSVIMTPTTKRIRNTTAPVAIAMVFPVGHGELGGLSVVTVVGVSGEVIGAAL